LVPALAFTLTTAEFEDSLRETVADPATLIRAVFPAPLAMLTVTEPLPPVTVATGLVLLH
jgi:hypothetical protein